MDVDDHDPHRPVALQVVDDHPNDTLDFRVGHQFAVLFVDLFFRHVGLLQALVSGIDDLLVDAYHYYVYRFSLFQSLPLNLVIGQTQVHGHFYPCHYVSVGHPTHAYVDPNHVRFFHAHLDEILVLLSVVAQVFVASVVRMAEVVAVHFC